MTDQRDPLRFVREAFITMLAESRFTEDTDGEYDSDGRAYGRTTYTIDVKASDLEEFMLEMGFGIPSYAQSGDVLRPLIDKERAENEAVRARYAAMRGAG